MSRITKIVSAVAIVLVLVSVPLVGFHTPAYADNSSDVCAGAGIATDENGLLRTRRGDLYVAQIGSVAAGLMHHEHRRI